MFVVGLTGGIGSGKSTVSKMLTELGVDVIDADLVAREVVRPGMKAWTLIRRHFGNEVILENQEIDRKKLGEIVFNDESKRKLLNNLPLLYETGKMTKFLSKIIVVNCSRSQQIERLIQRNNYSEEESISRIESQMALESKCKFADFVVDNSKDLEETRIQVQKVVIKLRSSKSHWKLRIALILTLFCIFVTILFVLKLLVKLFMY